MFRASRLPFAATALCGIVLQLATASHADIFVGTEQAILAFNNFDSGNAVPHTVWSGVNTGLDNFVVALAVDPVHREIWAAVLSVPELLVFSMDVSGNVAPLRRIAGAATGLLSPRGIVLDPRNDEVYTFDPDLDRVSVFPRMQDGDGAPIRSLEGGATTLDGPVFGFLDLVHNELFVSSVFTAARVVVFPRPTGTGPQNLAPLRALGGPGGFVSSPRAVYVDLPTNVLVLSDYAGRISFFPRTAQGTDTWTRQISGASTGLQAPFQIAVNRFGEVLVGTDTTAVPRLLVHDALQNGDVPPVRTIQGVDTQLQNPTGVATDFARDCSWGAAADGCIHRDNFESGELCYWNPVQGGAGCP